MANLKLVLSNVMAKERLFMVINPIADWNNQYQEERRIMLDELDHHGANSSASGPSARTLADRGAGK